MWTFCGTQETPVPVYKIRAHRFGYNTSFITIDKRMPSYSRQIIGEGGYSMQDFQRGHYLLHKNKSMGDSIDYYF